MALSSVIGSATIHTNHMGMVDGYGEEKMAASVQSTNMPIWGSICGSYQRSVEKHMGSGCKTCRGAPDAWANEDADADGGHVAAVKAPTVKQLRKEKSMRR